MGAGSEEVVGFSERSTIAVVKIEALKTPAMAMRAQPTACLRPTVSDYLCVSFRAPFGTRPTPLIL
jgi:hypothetical protein